MNQVFRYKLFALFFLVVLLVSWQTGYSAPLQRGAPQAGNAASYGPVTFSRDFNSDENVPIDPATHFDADTGWVYASLPYRDVAVGTLYSGIWYWEGLEVLSEDGTFDLSSGTLRMHIDCKGTRHLLEGKYRFVLEVEGAEVVVAAFTVGDASDPPRPFDGSNGTPGASVATTVQPTAAPGVIRSQRSDFGTITFCKDVTDDGDLIHPASTFPAGTTDVWAHFEYANMRDGMAWGDVWEENGETFIADLDRTWEDGASGWLALNLTNAPLPLQGEYKLTLFVEGVAIGEGSFYVEASEEPPAPTAAPVQTATREIRPAPSPADAQGVPRIGPITFCEDAGSDGQPIGTSDHFPVGTRSVAALFTYENMTDGTPWSQVWTRDGEPYASGEDVWTGGATGWEAYYIEADPDGDLSGDFTLTVYLDGVPARVGSFRVDGLTAPAIRQDVGGSHLGSIVFCEDVTDDGRPVNPTSEFPEGADAVWAYFTYDSMQSDQRWGRYWTLDGEPFIDSTGEIWEDETTGWTAYSISDPNGLEAGEYELTLYVGDTPVQQAAVQVAEYTRPQEGYFGAITFATGITDEREPIGTSRAFEFGVSRVYAIFDYFDMSPDQVWSAEWVINGEATQSTGNSLWGEGPPDGTSYLYFDAPDDQVMLPAEYGINLYLDGEPNQSAAFSVLEKPTPEPPARPEEVIDSDLLPAWHRLASCPHPTIQELAQVTLKYHIPIEFQEMTGANAQYIYVDTECNTRPGRVAVSPEAWNELSWEEVASKIGHELWHATQMLEGGYSCDCTVQKEVEAKIVELYVLRCLGREDILTTKWGGLWEWDGEHGTFDKATLWRALEEAYSECDLYEP